MAPTLKPIEEQVFVITGASSGIGLVTARTAAKKGARVVAAARSIGKLTSLVQELERDGAQAFAIQADVSKKNEVEAIAAAALRRFGRIDTWVNNAGLSIYGRLDEVEDGDSRRLFDINFWGVVYGSLTALEHLRKQGGALINVSSEVSEAVVPLQGMYSASKHAVKGFTDALRVEIEQVDKAPVSITLIQPTAVETPFPRHARNYLDKEPKLPDPKIDPQKVADAIIAAATKHTHHTKVGANAKIGTFVANNMPSISDRMAAKAAHEQTRESSPRRPQGTLYEAGEVSETNLQGSGA